MPKIEKDNCINEKVFNEINDILEKVYQSALKEYNNDKEKASAVAWDAVKKAGFKQNEKGLWYKEKELNEKNLIITANNFQPKLQPDGTILFPLLKKQKFFTNGIYGNWEIDEKKLKEIYNNFKNNINGYKIEGYIAPEHTFEPDKIKVVAFLEDIIFKNDELIGKIKPINEESKNLLLSGQYQYTSPEIIENYQNKKDGNFYGNTLIRFLFTNQPYQPDLTPAYLLDAKIENCNFKIIFLKEEDHFMSNEIKILQDELILVKKQLLDEQTKNSDLSNQIKILKEEVNNKNSIIKELNEKLLYIEKENFKTKLNKFIEDKKKENKILPIQIEKLLKECDVDKIDLSQAHSNFKILSELIELNPPFFNQNFKTEKTEGSISQNNYSTFDYDDPEVVKKLKEAPQHYSDFEKYRWAVRQLRKK